MIHGTIYPVWYIGKHKGIELTGLGGKPDDPVRTGCSGLFRSIIGCGTWIKIPGFPTFEISPDGVPIPQDPLTDPDDPDKHGNSDDQNQSAETTSRAYEKTSLKSEDHTPSTTSQSGIKISASTRSSTKSAASHSSSASASAAPTSYIIRLQPAISATQLEDMIDDVKTHASNMYSILLGSRPNDTVICAKLNDSSYAQLNDISLISSIILDQKVVLEEDLGVTQTATSSSLSARSLSKRLIENRGAYSYQSDPFVPALNFVSQPRNTILDQMASFGFPSTAGEGVDVYVPDTGVNTANNEFINMIGEYRWLEPPEGTWPGSEPWAPIDPSGHGTCVADKVAGYNYGVAKNANLVFLRVPDDDEEVFTSGMLLVFRMMVADIQKRKEDGYTKLPVVSISWGTTGLSEEFTEILFQAISNLMDQGTVLCILSGNMAAESYNVNAWPALAKERLDNIILVGAVDNDGLEAPFSQGGDLVDVWAPGVNLVCAYGAGDGTAPSPGRSGTSYATPQIAALAAIFIVAFGMDTVEQVKETIIDQAHSRNGGPDALYIGNPGDFCRSRRKRATRWDRRTDDACEAETLSAMTSATASPTVHSSSMAKLSSSVPHHSHAKTSTAVAAVEPERPDGPDGLRGLD